MGDDGWSLDGVELFRREMGFQTTLPPPRAPMKVSYKIPAPGHPDMDWTEPYLERGTTFSISGVINAENIPVERAWVEDEMLYVEGTVTF